MDKTLTIIKPYALQQGCQGKIIQQIVEAEFHILGLKQIRLTIDQAAQFYAIHKTQPFYHDLIRFMSSGPIISAVLQKYDAVNEFRKLIGATNPKKAISGTIRQLCGTDIQRNAVHGSDSNENALKEIHFFFSDIELMTTISEVHIP